MALTNSNLFSESFNIVETFLKNNITDPRNRYKKHWIHASMPNINAKGFNGYPFIVLRIDINEENKSFDVDTSNKVFRILLQIYSDEATEVDSISNQIFSLFKDDTKLSFQAKEVSSSPINYDFDMNGKKIIFRNLGIIARSRI